MPLPPQTHLVMPTNPGPDFGQRPQLISRWSDDTLPGEKDGKDGERKRDKLKRIGSKVVEKVKELLDAKSPPK